MTETQTSGATATANETRIEASAEVPTIAIEREFDHPRSRVFRAYTEESAVQRWLGPRSIETRMETWDCRTGGQYRYRALRDGEEVAAFYGSFHEVRPEERIVQTFTYDGAPDGVSLETATFTELEGGRTRLTLLSVVESMEIRDAILASGMESGLNEGFEKLDEILDESDESGESGESS